MPARPAELHGPTMALTVPAGLDIAATDAANTHYPPHLKPTGAWPISQFQIASRSPCWQLNPTGCGCRCCLVMYRCPAVTATGMPPLIAKSPQQHPPVSGASTCNIGVRAFRSENHSIPTNVPKGDVKILLALLHQQHRAQPSSSRRQQRQRCRYPAGRVVVVAARGPYMLCRFPAPAQPRFKSSHRRGNHRIFSIDGG